MKKWILSFGGIAALIGIFLAINVWLGSVVRTMRLDLTSEKLYTLAPGSKKIVTSLDEPIRLTLFYSSKAAKGQPQYENYARRVRELLEEFADLSKGKVVLRTVDPQPFSDEEDRAVEAGLAAIPVSQTENMYFGLVGTNQLDSREVIPFFDERNERLLEYDVARLIYNLSNPIKRTIGLMTSLPMEGMPMDPMTGQPSRVPPYQLMRELRALFEVQTVPSGVSEIPSGIDVLMVVHPKSLPDETQYAIDQFVMRGGRLLLCIDPLAEMDRTGQDPRNPMAAMGADRSSSIPRIMSHWGVEMAPGVIAGDLTFATKVVVSQRGDPVSFLPWISIDKTGISRSDAATGSLARVNIATSGVLRAIAGEAEKKEGDAPAATTVKLAIDPLLQTTKDSQEIPVDKVSFMPDPKALLAGFVPSGNLLTVGARLTLPSGSTLTSSFPAGRPADASGAAPADPMAGHIASRSEPIFVVVITDTDFLADQFWVQEDRLFGQVPMGVRKIADNGDMIVNLIDNLSGSSDLISLRARGEFARPFDRVMALEKQAEVKFRAEEQALLARRTEAQTKIDELQRARTDGGTTQAVLLSEEQQKELEKFQSDYLDARKQLRKVQFDMRRDIESLQARIKLINIALVPGAVAVGVLVFAGARNSRRNAARTTTHKTR